MTKRDDFLKLIGELSVSFSTLESTMGYILCEFVSVGEPFVGGILTADSPLHRKLRLIRKLASYRLVDHPELKKQLTDLVAAADALRGERNLWVHATWELNDEYLSQDKVRCLEFKWDLHEDGNGGGQMVGVRIHDFTIAELTELREQVQLCTNEALRLMIAMRSRKLRRAKQPLASLGNAPRRPS
jgi:hypothetical protein